MSSILCWLGAVLLVIGLFFGFHAMGKHVFDPTATIDEVVVIGILLLILLLSEVIVLGSILICTVFLAHLAICWFVSIL